MVQLNQLPKITRKRKKRVGRGYGSGVGGHTTTRGAKGLKARNKVPLTFDGTKIKKSWLKRLPFWRGKGRQKSGPKPIALNLSFLERHFKSGEKIDLGTLLKKNLIKDQEAKLGVKILSQGKLTKSLKVFLPCSQKALEKIEKIGGKVENEPLVKQS